MKKPNSFPNKTQSPPGYEHKMTPEPEIIRKNYAGSQKLEGKTALITGGDSGIGRSIAVHYAREGANIVIAYLSETQDAEATKKLVEAEGVGCILLKGDVKEEAFCQNMISETIGHFGSLNILVNNAAVQFPKKKIEEIGSEQVHTTFETNIYPFFYAVFEAVKHMKRGDCIINTTSVTAYRGSLHLLDYSTTKGAIVSFTRSASNMLAEKGIRVNGVAPGPIWTPLIPATFRGKDLTEFGKDTPMKRAGQPSEVAPAYVFLASDDASYITGQILHVNGGEIVGG